MPVMRRLNVGGVTYDTVGEASITQVLGSGTKIATVSIDGTSTDLYAPSGGSSVDPATANPSMDGTAAVGSSVKYAREDHVHPTDTSRATATHAHGDITNGGDITATAPTIASGDKLIINDESASKITNGPAFGTSTSTFLRNDGTWAEPSGGGNNTFYCTGTVSSNVLSVSVSGWDARAGNIIMAKLSNRAVTYSTCITSISVNSGESIPVHVDGAACSSVVYQSNYFPLDEGEVATFVYDGSVFQFVSKSLAFDSVIEASSLSTGDEGCIRFSTVTGSSENNVLKRFGIIAVNMVNAGTTENYTWGSSGGLVLKPYDTSSSAESSTIIWNGLAVGRVVPLSWQANEVLLFVKDGTSSNPRLVCKSGKIIPDALPAASTSTLGGVKVDGSTIIIDNNGVISASGGGSVSMDDTAVDAAVAAAWPSHNVTITLTNPDSSSSFTSCTIYELTSSSSEGLQIGSIDSPTGSTTVSIDSFSYGIRLSLRGGYVYPGTSTISGDIEETGIYDGFSAYMQYSVAGSGTITIDGISWND